MNPVHEPVRGSRLVHGSRFTDSGRVLVGSRFTVRPDAAPPGSFTVRGSPLCPASVRVHGSEFMVGSRVKTTELVHEPSFLSHLLHTDTVREPQFANHPGVCCLLCSCLFLLAPWSAGGGDREDMALSYVYANSGCVAASWLCVL